MRDFPWILKTLLNLQFSIVAVVISTVTFAKRTRGRQVTKITTLEDNDWNITSEEHIETNYVRLKAMKKW
jgi:uncharacterized membrane protein